jgi:hypothetical protein
MSLTFTWSCFWQCANILDYGLLIQLGYSQCSSPKVSLPLLIHAITFWSSIPPCSFHMKSLWPIAILFITRFQLQLLYSFKLLLSYFNLSKTWAYMHTSIISHHILFLLLIEFTNKNISATRPFIPITIVTLSHHWSLLAKILSTTTLYICAHSPITCGNNTIQIIFFSN